MLNPHGFLSRSGFGYLDQSMLNEDNQNIGVHVRSESKCSQKWILSRIFGYGFTQLWNADVLASIR